MKTLAPQHTERAFRRYEESIALVVDNYPQPTYFSSLRLAHETFRCRFRDAFSSFVEHGWPSMIDHKKASAAWPDISLATTPDNQIMVYSKTSSRRELAAPAERSSSTGTLCFAAETSIEHVDIIRAFVVLLHVGFLRGPLEITTKLPDICSYMEHYDVLIEELGGDRYRIT